MDMFEKCIEKFGSSQLCSRVQQIVQLLADLRQCMKSQEEIDCFSDCFEKCEKEGCEEACADALVMFMGTMQAAMLGKRASQVAASRGLSHVDAVALVFEEELKNVEEEDCPEKAISAQALAVAVIELNNSFQSVANLRDQAEDVLLLMAPALAVAHQCIGKDVFRYLELMKVLIKEETVKRIAAALEEGAVLVGNTTIKFKPVAKH